MKVIYMECTLALMQQNNIDVMPLLQSGVFKKSSTGINYLVIENERI